MKFGDNLQDSIYPAWSDNYVQYNVLKKQLEEGLSKPAGWTERDEGIFGQALDSDLTKVMDPVPQAPELLFRMRPKSFTAIDCCVLVSDSVA